MKIIEIISEGQVIHLPTSNASIKNVARIMTPEEYRAIKDKLPPHEMFYNFDGFGGVGIKYIDLKNPLNEVEELTHIGKRKGKGHPDDPTTEKELIKLGGKQLATMPDGHKIYLEASNFFGPYGDPRAVWNSYYAVAPNGKVDLALGADEKNNVLSNLSLYAINKQNTLKAHNFYAFLITKLGKTLVASEQSPGGHAVWRQLQKYHKNVSIHGWLNGKAVNVDMRDPEYTHASEYTSSDSPKEIQHAHKMELVATKKTGVNESIVIDEASLRHTLAAAGLAGALALGGSTNTQAPTVPNQGAPVQAQTTQQLPPPPTNDATDLTQKILAKYSVSPKLAAKIAHAAIKYEKPTFPKREDILAVIGIESSFDPNSVSGLKHDPAVGLMQVRPMIWNIKPSSLRTIDGQVRLGVKILHRYFNKLQSVPAAIHAYNVGITNFTKGKNLNPDYVQKFNDEKKLYTL